MEQAKLIKAAQILSQKYMSESGKGKRLVTNDDEALAYSIIRMPGTYGAISKALEYTFELHEKQPKTLLDVGAGTGAGTMAAMSLFEFEKITCLEREPAMLKLGKEQTGNKAEWLHFDINSENIPTSADLVICSYVLNELSEDGRLKALEKLWAATNDLLIIVEPGTMDGYSILMTLRKSLLNMGANIIAPCPHNKDCPSQWCHFSCRVQRSKLHKTLKAGDAPYEDEKFSYLAVSKSPATTTERRILRHPITNPGRIAFELCTKNGIEKTTVSKKDKDLYKSARKKDWGDSM